MSAIDIKEPTGEQVEKHRHLNKVTLKANLNFNVNSFKHWMKQKLTDDNKFFEHENDKHEKIMCLPKFSGSHIALTAMNEKLCYLILDKVTGRLTKDKTGLYNIKFTDLSDVIKVEPELRKNLYNYLDVYDSTLNYKDQYCIDEKTIKKYIDVTFGTSINISNEAFNLLVYILLKVCVRVLDSAFIMIQFAKKKSLSPKVILSCVSVHFSGTLEHFIKMRIDDAIKACGKELEDKEEIETKKEVEPIKEVEEETKIKPTKEDKTKKQKK